MSAAASRALSGSAPDRAAVRAAQSTDSAAWLSSAPQTAV